MELRSHNCSITNLRGNLAGLITVRSFVQSPVVCMDINTKKQYLVELPDHLVNAPKIISDINITLDIKPHEV